MTTFSKVLTLAAASATLGFVLIAACPASAFNSTYDDQRMALSHQGWVDYDEDTYDRPALHDYNQREDGVTSGLIAICPPGYHLGRGGALCWPN